MQEKGREVIEGNGEVGAGEVIEGSMGRDRGSDRTHQGDVYS